MGMDKDIFYKFTHKFIPITTIYDQLPNGPFVPQQGHTFPLPTYIIVVLDACFMKIWNY